VISGTESLGDTLTFDSLHITGTGTLAVNPYKAGGASGWVYVKANTITIDKGGSIVADAGGYPGVADMNGMCLPMSNGCGGLGVMAGLPGGGGGYFAAGADGTNESTAKMCQSYPTSPGGMAFFDMATKALALGSAGGAAHPLTTTPGTAGGNGGGGIQLQAAVVILNGMLSAAGATPNTAGGVGPGGGSGGSIEIFSAALSGAGTVSVNGGDGPQGAGIGTSEPPNNGGGGSGGVILLHLPAGASKGTLAFTASGGQTGTDCSSSANGGNGMEIDAPLTGTCIDVDGDGHNSKQCGGDDCDDSDPAVHPGALELCNGKDDNCDGQIDEAPNECTTKGEVCGQLNGLPMCVPPPPDGGADGGGADLSYIDVSGGCAVPEGLPRRGGPAVALGLAALAFAASRKRR
jgi:hypothetical protein